ncbi:MAG: RtcB family protein [Vicinamibacterales bacterium]
MKDYVGFGNIEQAAVDQLRRCLDVAGDDSRGVLCADHHKGYSMPIGGVVASTSVVMPAGVGYDIACGNCAVQTSLKAADVDTAKVMDEIFKVISFGMGRNNDERIDEHPVFDAIADSPVHHQRRLLQSARNQLGTVGSGNHYVDLFEDRADGSLWVGVHFGSRGLGHKTACGFLALAAGKEWDAKVDDSMDAPPTTIGIDTPLGQDYLAAMEIAGQYAYAGRDWVVDRVLKVLGTTGGQRIHNHHNFAWWEQHFGQRMLVIRKGATPAFPGQKGFIGASMGEDAVIVEGVDSPLSASALYSTMHGAGRVMSRTQAAGKAKVSRGWSCGQRACANFDRMFPLGDFNRGANQSLPLCPACGNRMRKQTKSEQVRPGVVDWPSWQATLKAQGVELRGAGADEAPQCYKRLPDVLAAHAGTIKILHTLRPIGVAMAGKDTFDPFKD